MQVHFRRHVPLESLPYFGGLFRGCTVWNYALRSPPMVPYQCALNGNGWTNWKEAWGKAFGSTFSTRLNAVQILRGSATLFGSTRFHDRFLQAQNTSDHGYELSIKCPEFFVDALTSLQPCLVVYFRLVSQVIRACMSSNEMISCVKVLHLSNSTLYFRAYLPREHIMPLVSLL